MSEGTPKNEPRWGQRQRFEFVEKRLYWEGTLGRSDLTSRFGISPAQASADLARYDELAPGNVQFDRSRKLFVARPTFVPRFFEPSARNYLTQLLLRADHAIPSMESWLGWEPAHDAIPKVRRKMDADTLRPVVNAIHGCLALDVYYQSINAPEPGWRRIAPHALAYDGSRWHARCWCYTKSRFIDFVLARMLSLRDTYPSTIDASLDTAWHRRITLELAPHPLLGDGPRRALEMDYGMTDGFIGIEMRVCLTRYFEWHMGLDLPQELLPPGRKQIVLRNRDELAALRLELGEVPGPA